MNEDISALVDAVDEYLPHQIDGRPFVTVTYAQSLDGRISAGRGLRTKLSGPESHKMTHYLRSKHDAILVGKGTLLADNPKLNCRYPGANASPQPVLLDSFFQWAAVDQDWAILDNAASGEGIAPWVIVLSNCDLSEAARATRKKALENLGGKILVVPDMNWSTILAVLHREGISSLMVEGGAKVIGSAVSSNIADSIIATVAPLYLGIEGVDMAPARPANFSDVKWNFAGVDAVALARRPNSQ